jgi:hypothetical protein
MNLDSLNEKRERENRLKENYMNYALEIFNSVPQNDFNKIFEECQVIIKIIFFSLEICLKLATHRLNSSKCMLTSKHKNVCLCKKNA